LQAAGSPDRIDFLVVRSDVSPDLESPLVLAIWRLTAGRSSWKTAEPQLPLAFSLYRLAAILLNEQGL
jgi:hypothetical protein